MCKIEQFEAFETRIAEIVKRFSFFDLRELNDDDIRRGMQRLKASAPLAIDGCGVSENFIDWWRILSDGETYEVRQFLTFYLCSCEDLNYRKTACKHIAFIQPISCIECGKPNEVRFEMCGNCEMDTAPIVRNYNDKPAERRGGVKI